MEESLILSVSFARVVCCLFLTVAFILPESVHGRPKFPRQEEQRVEELTTLLASKDPEEHKRAATALVRLGEPGYPALAAALNTYDRQQQSRTIQVLVELGEESVPALLAAIRLQESGDLRNNGGV
ncbi:MAG: hypothetical protein AAF581_22625, partial [Planctomycetota bacterium]